VADTYPRAVEDRDVLIVRGEERQRRRLRCWLDGHSGPFARYRIELDAGRDLFTATGPDVYDTLIRLRCQLEFYGFTIALQGARRDTAPSGMLRSMGDAREVYVLREGERHATRDDIVVTLDDAEVELLGTVEEQRAYVMAWYAQDRP